MFAGAFIIGALCVVTTAAWDSEGNDFNIAFLRNGPISDQSASQNVSLSVTIVNGNDQDCDVTFGYYPDLNTKNKPRTLYTQTTKARSSSEFFFPSWYSFDYVSTGLQELNDPIMIITATAICNLSLIANNYNRFSNQGDSFLVLPKTWAATEFTFTLPGAMGESYGQHMLFMPTVNGTTVHVRVVGQSSEPSIVMDVDGPTVYYMAKNSVPATYRVWADKPFQVVAGVMCAGSLTTGKCDHIAYMPQPLASTECRNNEWQSDDHFSDLHSANTFFIDIPRVCSTDQPVRADGEKASRDLTIPANKVSPLNDFSSGTLGEGLNFHAWQSSVHVTRFFDGSKSGIQGAVIDVVPSLPQFIPGGSSFYTRQDGDEIDIVCTAIHCTYMQIDNVRMLEINKNFTTHKIEGMLVYLFHVNINSSGYHEIEIDPVAVGTGSYSYYIHGEGAQRYGLSGPMQFPAVVPVVASSTTSPTTVTTTTAGPTSSTTSNTSPSTVTTTPSTSATTQSPASQSPSTTGSTVTAPSTTLSTTVTTPSTTVSTVTTPSTTVSTVTTPSTTVTTVTTPSTTITTVSTTTAPPNSNPSTSPTTPTNPVTTPTTPTNPPTSPTTTPTVPTTTPTLPQTTPTTSSTTTTTTTTKPPPATTTMSASQLSVIGIITLMLSLWI